MLEVERIKWIKNLETLFNKENKVRPRVKTINVHTDITIIGMFCCFIGVNNDQEYWEIKNSVSKSIDTACASSLVAMYDVRQNLLLNESDYVFLGGVNVLCHPMKYISFSKSRLLRSDGRSKTWDDAIFSIKVS